MFFITDNRRWTRQPSYPATVNACSPFADGLVAALLPSPNTATSIVDSPFGKAGVFAFTPSPDSLLTGTVAAGLFRQPGASNLDNCGYLAINRVGAVWASDVETCALVSYSTGGARKNYFIHNVTETTIAGAIPAPGSYEHAAIVYDGSISTPAAKYMVSGSVAHSFVASGTFPWNSGARVFLAGNVDLGIYATYLAVWSTQKSSDFLREFAQNPWQIFAPRRDVLYFFPATVPPARRINSLFRGRPF